MKNTNVIAIADEAGFDYIEVASPRSWRPTRGALIGFANWEELEEVANEYGLTPVLLVKADGGNWVAKSCAYYPIDVVDYIDEDINEVYYPGDYSRLEDAKAALLDAMTEEEKEAVINRYAGILDELKQLKVGDILIVPISGGSTTVVPCRVMRWHEDNKYYCVGLIDESDEE